MPQAAPTLARAPQAAPAPARAAASWRSRWPDYAALAVLAAGYAALASFHEPWRDEAQAWLIARESPNPLAMLGLMGYEGTPGLWHLILYALSHAGLPYRSIHVVHTGLAIAALAVLFLRSPFTRTQKVLLASGYFLLYEYNAIARSYVLSVLFLFLLAATHRERFERPVLYGTLLALLANTNVHSLAVAFVLSSGYLAQLLARGRPALRGRALAALAIAGVGGLAAAAQLAPPADLAPHLQEWDLTLTPEHFQRTAIIVGEAFFPLSLTEPEFWDRPWIREELGRSLARGDTALAGTLLAASVLLYAASVAAVWRDPHARWVYLAASLAIIAIFHFKYPGSVRHHGLIFLAFVYAAWLAASADRAPAAPRRAARAPSPRVAAALLVALLAAQAVSTTTAVQGEVGGVFSASAETARFLQALGLPDERTLLVSNPGPHATSILPYLPAGTRFHALEYRGPESYMTWSEEWYASKHLEPDEVLRRVEEAARQPGYDRVILVSNGPWPPDPPGALRFEELAFFDAHLLIDENFYLYRVTLEDAPAPPG